MTTNKVIPGLDTLPKGYFDEQGRRMGLWLNLPESEYFPIFAFSFSGSKALQRSPMHFQNYLKKEYKIDPDREKFKAVHVLNLEPEAHNRIVVKDGKWAGDLKKEVYELKSKGFIVLKKDDHEEAKAITECMKAHSLASAILSNSLCEVSIFWVQDGIYCKCRIDVLSITEHGICLGDLKNYGDLSNEYLLGDHIGKQKYNWQMAHYSNGIRSVFGQDPIKRYWIFVEDKSDDGVNHGIKVRNCPDALVDAGEASLAPLRLLFKECTEKNEWPGYSEEESDAGMPDKYFPGVSYE